MFLLQLISCLAVGLAVWLSPTFATSAQAAEEYEASGNVYQILPSSLGYSDIGIASWYGTKFHGRMTSMGEPYDMRSLTAAHRELPLPTMLQVTNLDNGRQVVVRVNDRGPFHDDRIIDLSFGAAKMLGFERRGTATVVIEAIDHLNYPHRVSADEADSAVYLQVGAWSVRKSAERKLAQTRLLLAGMADSRILESGGENGLYKVWVGPLASEVQREEVRALVQRELGEPMLVLVPKQ